MGMGSEIGKIKEIGDLMAQHGRDIIIALALVVVGLIVIKWINQGLKRGLSKLTLSHARASVVAIENGQRTSPGSGSPSVSACWNLDGIYLPSADLTIEAMMLRRWAGALPTQEMECGTRASR